MVDELAPAGGEQVPPRSSPVNMAKIPNDAVEVGDGERLDRRLGLVVKRGEDGVGAEPRDGEATAIVGVRRSEDLRERNDLIGLVGVVKYVVVRWLVAIGGFVVGDGEEKELGEDLVGCGIGDEMDGGDAAKNERLGEDERGEEERGGGGGLLEVALREVVNPRMEDGNLYGVSGTGSPDFGVDRTVGRVRVRVRVVMRRRMRRRRHFGVRDFDFREERERD